MSQQNTYNPKAVLFIENYPARWGADDLIVRLEAFGEVLGLRMLSSKNTNKPFSHILMRDEADAESARKYLNNMLCEGRTLRVKFHQEREPFKKSERSDTKSQMSTVADEEDYQDMEEVKETEEE
jgi:RNA recognition motif-containing protein